MNKKIIFSFFLCCMSMQVFAQFRSGLTVNGGITHAWNEKLNTDDPSIKEFLEWDWKMTTCLEYNVALGYKFRLAQESNRLFYDIDYFLGLRKCGIMRSVPDPESESGIYKSKGGGFRYFYI